MWGHGGWGQGRQDTGCPLMLILKDSRHRLCVHVWCWGVYTQLGVGLH